MAATRDRHFRCNDELWSAAKVAAAAEGRTVTDVLMAALRRLVAEPQHPALRPAQPWGSPLDDLFVSGPGREGCAHTEPGTSPARP